MTFSRLFDPADVIMSSFTIYFQPEMGVTPYRMREFFMLKGGRTVPGPVRAVGNTLQEVRDAVPVHAEICLARNTSDAPEIVETWL